MRLCILSTLVAIVIGAMVVGLLRAGPAADRQHFDVTPLYVVEIHDNYFDPPGLFLQLHESVTWVLSENAGNSGHSTTSYHPSQDKELRIPENAQPFNSGLFKRLGRSFTYKFTIVGVYDYFCIPHEDVGMVGRIIVQEATGPGTRPLDQGISVAGQSLMPSIEEILTINGQIFGLLARMNAIALFTQQNQRDPATAQFKLIQQDWLASQEKAGSLYEALKSVEMQEEFTRQLNALEEALSKKSSINTVVEHVRRAKDILNRAMSKLSQRKLG